MKTNRLEKGFSLVELMVAVAILAVGMAAVGTMLLSSFQSSRHNRNVRSAETVLRYFAEQFSAGKDKSGNLICNLPVTGDAVVRGNTIITDADADPGTFYCKWVSNPYQASSLNQIDLTVGWGKSKSATVPCNRANLTDCPYVLLMTNFY